MEPDSSLWQFWIDRGGTFTDVVGRKPDGSVITHKLLSENPGLYKDSAIQGIRELLEVDAGEALPSEHIEVVKMGTTVATNALLERQGDATVLVTTLGFGDALRIGYQTRPDLFALDIELPDMLYSDVIEVDQRTAARGEEIRPLDETAVRTELQRRYDSGFRSAAIVFMHGYRFPDHEKRVALIAKDIGFTQVSTSHETIPLMKMVSRGDTTVVDAYLSPILRRYVDQVHDELQQSRLMFMQSGGGLTDAHYFKGKNSILSGPAGGVVGMVKTAAAAGFDKLIGFDMGGTSTDVCHYAGEYERTLESEVAGVRLRAPMMRVHTVAAGGGSVLHFDGARYRIGPDSAGASPGPAGYRNGGPLTVTDCNIMLGKLQGDFFPAVFGNDGNQPLDVEIAKKRFQELSEEIKRSTGISRTAEEVAQGFLSIAVENMANAVKLISVQRGYDVSTYTLCSFGGAGGQHACLVADAIGIKRIFMHPHAGVLSALGIGLADQRVIREKAVGQTLHPSLMDTLEKQLILLGNECTSQVKGQGARDGQIESRYSLHLRYHDSDTVLQGQFGAIDTIRADFEARHKQQFGFFDLDKELVVEALQAEVIVQGGTIFYPERPQSGDHNSPVAERETVMDHQTWQTPFYRRELMFAGAPVDGPAVIVERTGTVVVEPGWRALLTEDDNIVLERVVDLPKRVAVGTQVDPVMLEIFNNLFMNIAEQMGLVLANTSGSVNIKERLDFSCAVFDQDGELIANAPHMPVHLGSMSQSIKTVIRENEDDMNPGDAWMLNAPYNGGTHLPDITVIKPIFLYNSESPQFYVAARGHHADIGGIDPGSMPSNSTSVEQEGILLDNVKILSKDVFLEKQIRGILSDSPWPARSPDTNITDLKAQVAACEKGALELIRTVDQFGLNVVQAYMQHVQDNAEESVRRVLDVLTPGSFSYEMDDGSIIKARISLNKERRCAKIDFTGTSAQHPGNLNAPSSVAVAAVLYVFRCLVDDDIPLNAGCLKPIEIVIPENSMINPGYPAAVVAGNVETSQCLVDTLFGALEVAAGSQGTMNNFTWGNQDYQYYETICGGAGATRREDGTDAVHTHMTNSRLTDPEVLEWRFPVRLESFSIRKGSGGPGAHRGGDGTVRKVRFLQDMKANILSGHRTVAPYGMHGGKPGETGRNYVEHADGSVTELGSIDEIQMHSGDTFVVETPGGGGYGQ